METNKVLSALCYFSVIFAPFVVPIIIYFVVDDKNVKGHAKSSLISHIIPAFFFLFVMISVFTSVFIQGDEFPTVFFLSVILFVIVNVIIFIWNIVRGIKVLIK